MKQTLSESALLATYANTQISQSTVEDDPLMLIISFKQFHDSVVQACEWTTLNYNIKE